MGGVIWSEEVTGSGLTLSLPIVSLPQTVPAALFFKKSDVSQFITVIVIIVIRDKETVTCTVPCLFLHSAVSSVLHASNDPLHTSTILVRADAHLEIYFIHFPHIRCILQFAHP